MRPSVLFPLFAPITSLPGIGQRLAKPIERLCGPYVRDLAWHLPSGFVDRRYSPTIAVAESGQVATLLVKVERHLRPHTQRQPYKVRCSDGTGFLDLVFFNAREDYLQRMLPPGQRRAISGKIDVFSGERNMVHPDHIVAPEELSKIQTVEPVYPMTAGVAPKVLKKAIDAALARMPELPEWLDAEISAKHNWPSWKSALFSLHRPTSESDLLPLTPNRSRLAFDELLANQLALALARQQSRRTAGRVTRGNGQLTNRVIAVLPYQLTNGQRQALAEIASDMAAPHRMLRLLQGDVGSGKTIVALLAMLTAVESGGQSALLAPTDILARQHFASLSPLCQAADVEIALITGRDKGKSREAMLARLASGELKLIVGTHALVQEDIVFNDLRLAVIDEQHRFGVEQRMALAQKGQDVDLLVMTATPIPRTLMLTAYGDVDSSRLTEKPAGRLPIDTRTIPADRMEEVVIGLRRAISAGARIYWVCPLVDESELIDLAAATERAKDLAGHFGDRVGLVHGKQKAAERDAVMAAFAAGDLDILVATTVIEVGVNVPEATVMVIEHAERFGLAQLHQLRGRVGRGTKKSSCILLYQTPPSETAKARLAIMRETEDGFRIAEEDLRLRGGGELLGTRQSGLPEFHFADLSVHGDLLVGARDQAKLIMTRDPHLRSAKGEAIRVLLYLFQHDAMVKLLTSG